MTADKAAPVHLGEKTPEEAAASAMAASNQGIKDYAAAQGSDDYLWATLRAGELPSATRVLKADITLEVIRRQDGELTAATETIAAGLIAVTAMQAERDAANQRIAELEALVADKMFRPIGDNHHNAWACPYCNPKREANDKLITDLRAELAAAKKDDVPDGYFAKLSAAMLAAPRLPDDDKSGDPAPFDTGAELRRIGYPVDDVQRDAERYRWLRDKGYSYHDAATGTASMSLSRGPYINLEVPSCNRFNHMALCDESADAIIDAALAAQDVPPGYWDKLSAAMLAAPRLPDDDKSGDPAPFDTGAELARIGYPAEDVRRNAEFGQPRKYLTDDRDSRERHELIIMLGGNGDWYVSVLPEGNRIGPTVRLCTSGGASSRAPGLTVAISKAYRALAAQVTP